MALPRTLLVIAALASAAGCGGGGRSNPAAPATATTGAPPAAPASDGDPSAAGPAAPASGPLDAADCGRLLDHYLALEVADMRARMPADQVPTDAQLEAIRQSFAKDAMAGCVGAARPPFDCAMAARTAPAARACLTPPAGAAP